MTPAEQTILQAIDDLKAQAEHVQRLTEAMASQLAECVGTKMLSIVDANGKPVVILDSDAGGGRILIHRGGQVTRFGTET